MRLKFIHAIIGLFLGTIGGVAVALATVLAGTALLGFLFFSPENARLADTGLTVLSCVGFFSTSLIGMRMGSRRGAALETVSARNQPILLRRARWKLAGSTLLFISFWGTFMFWEQVVIEQQPVAGETSNVMNVKGCAFLASLHKITGLQTQISSDRAGLELTVRVEGERRGPYRFTIWVEERGNILHQNRIELTLENGLDFKTFFLPYDVLISEYGKVLRVGQMAWGKDGNFDAHVSLTPILFQEENILLNEEPLSCSKRTRADQFSYSETSPIPARFKAQGEHFTIFLPGEEMQLLPN